LSVFGLYVVILLEIALYTLYISTLSVDEYAFVVASYLSCFCRVFDNRLMAGTARAGLV